MHVAIIMDGNGRWATRRGLSRATGHRAGVAAVRRVVECAPDLNIRHMTLSGRARSDMVRALDFRGQEVLSVTGILQQLRNMLDNYQRD